MARITDRMTGEGVTAYLRGIIDSIDGGKGRAPGWVRRAALPAAMGLALGLGGCTTEPEGEVVTRAMAADAKADGHSDDLCELIGAEAGCDLCGELGWYDDGTCDEFCDLVDLDCGAVELYGVPMPEDDCANGLDDDGDGAVDCADSDCGADPLCGATARYMAPFEDCSDGVDNDGDGLVDCDAPACSEDPACVATARYMAPFEDCSDGADNDGDGLVDCDDPACSEDPACVATARYMAPFAE